MTARNVALALSALLVPAFPTFAQDVEPQSELKDDVKDDMENDDGFKPADEEGEQGKEPKAGVGSKSPEAGETGKVGVGSKSPEAGEGDRVAHGSRSFVFMIDDEDFSEWMAEAARSEQQASANQARSEDDTTLEAGTPRDEGAKYDSKDKVAGECVKLEGTIAELREFEIEGQDDDHDMLRVRTTDGRVCIVDLGPDEHDLDLENGDLVCVEGQNGTINGQKVLFAHEISEKAKISWSGIEGMPLAPAPVPAPSGEQKDAIEDQAEDTKDAMEDKADELEDEADELDDQ